MRPRSMRDLKSPAETTLNQSEVPATRRVAGLRDVMATRKVASRSVPATRSQQLSEIAWLDRELERLRREASILDANLARVNARVVEVNERRTLLMDMIRKDLGLEFAQPAARAAVVEEEEPAAKVDQFSLEY
jgi:hypothetical protein